LHEDIVVSSCFVIVLISIFIQGKNTLIQMGKELQILLKDVIIPTVELVCNEHHMVYTALKYGNS